jgi:phosphatidate cytidylyltransferase
MVSIAFTPTLVRFAPLAVAGIFLILSGSFLRSYDKNPSQASFADLSLLLAGIVYLPVMLQFFRFLAPVEIMLVLVCTFATDTGGFYSGRLWGSAKIWPTISPKKTWAGSFGGMGLTTLCCLLIGIVWGTSPWWSFIFLGLLLNVAAQFGDFFESALKRSSGVKDSGHILPGHGGIMDRIDSLLFALPVYMLTREAITFF